MNIHKYAEAVLNNNDIYLLETLGDKVVINRNNTGLIFLDSNLKEIDQRSISPLSSCYNLFKSYGRDALLLYGPDDEVLIYVSLATKIIFPISLKQVVGVFSSIYCWIGDTIILTTYDRFYQVDIVQKNIREISPKTVNVAFYNFWKAVREQAEVWDIDFCRQCFIYKEAYADLLVNYNYLSGQKITVPCPATTIHEVIYNDGIFACVSEKELFLLRGNTQLKLTPSKGYIFLHTRFMSVHTQCFLVVLASSVSNPCMNTLSLYTIL